MDVLVELGPLGDSVGVKDPSGSKLPSLTIIEPMLLG
jgi:hypothetical protein